MTEGATPGISIAVDYDRRVNWAMQQNDVPVVKLLRIRNDGDAPLDDLVVRLSVASGIANVAEARIVRIDPGGTWNLETIDLAFDPEALARQLEQESTTLDVTVLAGDAIAAQASYPIDVLAWNEWGGLVSLPEILAAFVTPNHPAIDGILSRAGQHMAALSGDSSLNGYQSKDPTRVCQQVEAVYRAVQDLGIGYVNPPASYEDRGQKVRLADRILENKLATCLDLALLLAACLEQSGLNPLLVLVDGHAFVGAWAVQDSFSEPGTDDAARLRKRIQLDEIVAVEATAVTTRPLMDFGSAQKAAFRHLEDVSAFRVAVDVTAARRMRIRPLPVRGVLEGRPEFEVSPPQVDVPAEGSAAPAGTTIPEPVEAPPLEREPDTRLDRWKRRLLDLSLRNRLINYRETKRTIPLMCPDVGAVEDALAVGKAFAILKKPELDDGPRDPEADAVEGFLADDLKRGRLHAKLGEDELERRLVEVWRSGRRDLEESGANTLYLAVGFLSWYETPTSRRERWAPILLLPLEMVRRSAREGFVIRRSDDDALVNVTLLEKLRSEFDIDRPELAEVPEDEAGVDVQLVLRRFREAIKDLDRWDVLDEVALGLFSFTKFLMWLDLQARSERLMENPVVRLLLEGDAAAVGDGPFPEPESLDENLAPAATLCPMDADSSQLVAVQAASNGRSFVLQGPPGTGKSQTISNLIAHALGHGQRVLFVAEKRAALEVVHNRLTRVGLEPFCLELHSNKTRKRDVLDSIRAGLDHVGARAPGQWEARADDLFEARLALNEYVQEMHRTRPLGLSAFQVTSRLVGLRDVPRLRLGARDLKSIDGEGWETLREHADALATAAGAVGTPAQHPLAAVAKTEWDTKLADRVVEAVDALHEAIAQLAEVVTDVGQTLGVDGPEHLSELRLEALFEVALLLTRTPGPPVRLLTEPGWSDIESDILRWVARGRARDDLRADVLGRWHEDLLRLDLEDLVARLRSAADAFAPIRWWRRWGVRRALRSVAVGTMPPSEVQLEDLEKARTLKVENAALANGHEIMGVADEGWDAVETTVAWAGRFRGALITLAARNAIPFATERRDEVSEDAPFGRRLRELLPARDRFNETRSTLVDLLQLDVARAFGGSDADDLLARVRDGAARLSEHREALRGWCHWRRMREQAVDAGVPALAISVETGETSPEDAGAVLDRSFHEAWLSEVTDGEPVLRRFNSDEHARRIRRFRRLDRLHMELTEQVVDARLSARVPEASDDVSPSSEVGILQRQFKLKRRHMPVRQLIGRLPNLLPRLKPCLLMSPLSVAQYLDPEYPPFDIVIFDEASQIPPWDAVGAIARGARAVVVGDSRQLPPTSFFAKQDDDEDIDEDDLQEVESILDECEASGLSSLRLLWHYRSRHESLIAFSNWHYYDNRLLTFPAAEHESDALGVSLRAVQGVYDRSRSRTNRVEAEAIVDEVVARLAGAEDDARTIGVVAFSLAQQTLIEDLLDAARRRHPEIEPHFSDSREEPVFVKNLENVQGDERDVILFSVCYGPDANGKVAMNFGPLNREGGERRLNVAVTRARRQVVVFTSMLADSIDLSRTRAVGARHLKTFLDYAERGPRAMSEALFTRAGADTESPFEADVLRAIEARGWEVDCQVGCSGYRIDLGVKNPDVPGSYLLGVECDGATYHSAHTARDRDRTRAAVLRSLGWRLHRVWATDWWHDPTTEIGKLESALAEALEAHRAGYPHEQPDEEEDEEVEALEPEPSGDESGPVVHPVVPEGPRMGDGDDLYEGSNAPLVAGRLAAIVEQLAPVHVDRAVRCVASSWGVKRLTSKLRDHVIDQLAAIEPARRPSLVDDFLWCPGTDPGAYGDYRVPAPGDPDPREAHEIPPVEIANAARDVLAGAISMPAADLAKDCARRFGFKRMGDKIQAAMDAGIHVLVERGGALRDGDRVTAP